MLLSKNEKLTDDLLTTFFCTVENLVNSRPLTKNSDDVEDSMPITPNHLLLLRGGPMYIPGKFGAKDFFKCRWKYVHHLADQFWRKWLREYLPELQRRNKWMLQTRNLARGDLVLICDENTPRGLWPLGLVTEINIGRDGLVRSATVRTKSTHLVRPATKLVLLEGVQESG